MNSARMTVAAVAVMLSAAGCDEGIGYEYPTPPTPEPLPEGYVWTELPDMPEELPQNNVMITHYSTFNRKYSRSYSMMYDTKEKVSYWVAYPLHSIYIGNSGRQDSWAYDPSPKITQNQQMPLQSGYGWGRYDRGHQLPSADRTITVAANDQTFYFTNMTPQNSTLNQGEWASLEAWVRTKAAESRLGGRYDTLYVVTGCAISTAESPEIERRDKNGVTGAIPKGYYKVLLRTRSGKPRIPDEKDAECIGFWMENKAPSGGWKAHVKTVAEIEEITNISFFPVVSSTVKSRYNPAQWGL